jgi:hypothetical protein
MSTPPRPTTEPTAPQATHPPVYITPQSVVKIACGKRSSHDAQPNPKPWTVTFQSGDTTHISHRDALTWAAWTRHHEMMLGTSVKEVSAAVSRLPDGGASPGWFHSTRPVESCVLAESTDARLHAALVAARGRTL